MSHSPTPAGIGSALARRAVLAVYVGCFSIGGLNHARDFMVRGWRPYRWASPPFEAFWSSLILLDFAVVALLLCGRRRSGLLLAATIMIADVIVNTTAILASGISDFSVALVLQSIVLGFVLGSIAFVWPADDRY